MTTIDCHNKALERLCRVCASLVKKDSTKKLEVEKHKDNLKSAFWIEDLDNDCSDTHPKQFCRNCYYTMINIVKKKRTHCRTEVFTWEKYSENCKTCILYNERGKGGRNKKPVQGQGSNIHNRVRHGQKARQHH